MKNNIIDIYYERRENNIFEYLKILIKNIVENNQIFVEQYKTIVQQYMIDVHFSCLDIIEETKEICAKDKIENSDLKTSINYVLTYIDDKKIKKDYISNSNIIILMSKILLIAIEIEKRINIIINENVTYSKVIKDIISDYDKILDDDLTNKLKQSEKELKGKMKENILEDKDFFKTLRNNNFNISFLKVSNTKECDYYEVKFDYAIKTLDKFLARDGNNQVITEGLNNRFVIITAELLSIVILKSIYRNEKEKKFLIEIPDTFFENEDNVNDLIIKLSNLKIKERVCLKIPYKLLTQNKTAIKQLVKNDFQIVTCDMKNINERRDKSNFTKIVNILVEPKNFINDNNKIIAKFMQETVTQLLEDISNSNQVINEKELLFS